MVSPGAASIYRAAQDAFGKQNKQLYPQTLDSLRSLLTKAANTSSSKGPTEVAISSPATPPLELASSAVLDDQSVRFYLQQVLPLLFDGDWGLQQKAIATIEALLPHIGQTAYDQLPEWPAIKETIAEQYCKQVNTLRDRHNSNWHLVWSVLVRLIHKDILRSATLINRYLSIVEQGFRNPNLTVRAEAFLCWRVLVQLFATHQELLAPKRIKLVCIPLKSSQSKTEQIAVNKFSVWWFLMTEVHSRLVEYTDTIVEPFLVFCFGPLGIQPLIGPSSPGAAQAPVTAPGKTFEKLTPLVLSALLEMLGDCAEVGAAALAWPELGDAGGAERLQLRRPFAAAELFAKIGKVLVNSAGEATLLVAKLAADRRMVVGRLLWQLVAQRVNGLRCLAHFNLMLDNLYALENCTTQTPTLNPLCAHIVHTVASTDSFLLSASPTADSASTASAASAADQIPIAVQRVLLLLLSPTLVYTDAQAAAILDTWLPFATIAARTGCSYRDLTKRTLKILTSRPADASLPIRLAMWQRLAAQFVDHNAEFAAESGDCELLHQFLLLPISLAPQHFAEHRDTWLQLARTVRSLDRQLQSPQSPLSTAELFATRAVAAIRLHAATIAGCANGLDILAALIDAEPADFDAATGSAPGLLLDQVDTLCSGAATTLKDLNGLVHSITAYTRRLDGPQLLCAYRRLKATITRLETAATEMRCDRAACAEFRKICATHVRSRKATQTLIRALGSEAADVRKELLDMLAPDSDFVIVPTLWKFNPENLTDGQRDKMKERKDNIPALYNDTSQSQESRSIKPWTPAKLVLVGAKDSLVIEAAASNSSAMEAKETEQPPSVATVTSSNVSPEARVSLATGPAECEPEGGSQRAASVTSPATATPEPAGRKRATKTPSTSTGRLLKNIQMDIVDADEYHKTTALAKRATRNANKLGGSSQSPSRSPTASLPLATGSGGAGGQMTRRKSVDSKAGAGEKKPRGRPPNQKRIDPVEEATTAVVGRKEKGKLEAKEKPGAVEPEPSADITAEEIEASQEAPKSPNTARLVRRSMVKLTPIAATAAVAAAETLDTRTMDTVPMDTQCAAEVADLAAQVNGSRLEAVVTNGVAVVEAAAKAVDSAAAEADTETQSSQLDTLDMDTPMADSEAAASSTSADDVEMAEPVAPASTAVEVQRLPSTPTKPKPRALDAASGEEVANTTILCSPQLSDVHQRTADLLNDTLTISPIKNADDDGEGVERMVEGDELPEDVPSSPVADVGPVAAAPVLGAVAATAATAAVVPVAAAPAPVAVISLSPPSSSSSSSQPISLRPAGSSSTPLLPMSQTSSPSSRYPQFKGGRGAQLLNIIASKKKRPLDDFCMEPAPSSTSTPTATSTNGTSSHPADPAHPDSSSVNAHPESRDTFEEPLPVGMLPTPKRNLLTFSKTLPSPLASPSSSILKRKYPVDDPADNVASTSSTASSAVTIIDACATPPVLKKKRVSFHDPPVSVTKEYISHAEEHNERPSMSKIMIAQQQAQLQQQLGITSLQRTPQGVAGKSPGSSGLLGSGGGGSAYSQRMRNVLRRKSRADSMVEFAKLNSAAATSSSSPVASTSSTASTTVAAVTGAPPSRSAAPAEIVPFSQFVANTTADMEPLQWNSSNVSGIDPLDLEADEAVGAEAASSSQPPTTASDDDHLISTAELDQLIAPLPAALRAYDEPTILQYVAETSRLETVLAAFSGQAAATAGPDELLAVARSLTRELSALMRADERVCRETLDEMSERHAEQFLNHAIVENLGSTVCARLAPSVLVAHLREVAMADVAVRRELVEMVALVGGDCEAKDLADLDVQAKRGLVAMADLVREKKAAEEEVAPSVAAATNAAAPAGDLQTVAVMLGGEPGNVAGLSDEQMAVMRTLIDRPLTDQQICDFMGIFSRNRRN